MKSINNYLFEALIKKDTKIKSKPWTIEDAQDGDIISIESQVDKNVIFIIIFKKIDNDIIKRKIKYYGYYYSKKKVFTKCDDEESYFSINTKHWLSTEGEKQKLFNSMKDAGYKWDPNKKELVKL